MARMIPHGGKCCGMTHLYLEGSFDPDIEIAARKKFAWDDIVATGNNITAYPHTPAGQRPVIQAVYNPPAYSEDRPKETRAQRAKALIDGMMTKGRTSGIIEVVLAGSQKAAWHDYLISWGFKEAATAVNSNSNNRITVYLLAYGEL